MDQLRGTRSVGVHVAHHIQPLFPGACDEPQHFRHGGTRVAPPDRLEMADLQRRFQRACDLQHLAQRVHHAVALLAHMHTDGNAAFVQRRKRADQAIGRVKDLRRIAKPQRHAARAVGQRLFHVIVQIAQLKR